MPGSRRHATSVFSRPLNGTGRIIEADRKEASQKPEECSGGGSFAERLGLFVVLFNAISDFCFVLVVPLGRNIYYAVGISPASPPPFKF